MNQILTQYRRVCCLLLAVLLVLGLCLHSAPPVHADRKSELQSQLNAAQKDLEKVQQQIKDNQANKQNAEALKNQLQQEKNLIISQMTTVREKINYVEAQIADKEAEIAQKEQEIEQKQQEYDARWAGFKQRMRAMQRLNDSGTLAILANATSLYQLLTFPTMMEKIAEKDTEICEDLENQRIDLENARTELDNARIELENNKTELEGDRDRLSAMEGQLTANIQTQDANISAAEANAQALDEAEAAARKKAEDAKKALDSYLNSLINQYSSAAITCSLNFGPPIASYKYISDTFGHNGHRGTDFAAPGGTAIYAVADGIVTNAEYHWSWGNYVQIYHGKDDQGKTYSTLYAHMIQSPSVSAGQKVTRGQVIGYVGNTGYSFGNHLHLEMKINGALVNSASYVPH